MRKPVMAANWKMNKTSAEAAAFINDFKKMDIKGEVIICPPFTALSALAKELQGTSIKLGAQNMHFEKSGAFTGEISASMLKDIGCTYVILGHSERREIFKESNEFINKKIKMALSSGLRPILCVGEKLEEREQNRTKKVIEEQVKNSLIGISKEEMANIIIAYEPVWAIGTGKTATPQQAEDVHYFIRKLLIILYGQDTADKVSILYGGSVKPDNAKELMSMANIDGALIGGASLQPKSFSDIINF